MIPEIIKGNNQKLKFSDSSLAYEAIFKTIINPQIIKTLANKIENILQKIFIFKGIPKLTQKTSVGLQAFSILIF